MPQITLAATAPVRNAAASRGMTARPRLRRRVPRHPSAMRHASRTASPRGHAASRTRKNACSNGLPLAGRTTMTRRLIPFTMKNTPFTVRIAGLSVFHTFRSKPRCRAKYRPILSTGCGLYIVHSGGVRMKSSLWREARASHVARSVTPVCGRINTPCISRTAAAVSGSYSPVRGTGAVFA